MPGTDHDTPHDTPHGTSHGTEQDPTAAYPGLVVLAALDGDVQAHYRTVLSDVTHVHVEDAEDQWDLDAAAVLVATAAGERVAETWPGLVLSGGRILGPPDYTGDVPTLDEIDGYHPHGELPIWGALHDHALTPHARDLSQVEAEVEYDLGVRAGLWEYLTPPPWDRVTVMSAATEQAMRQQQAAVDDRRATCGTSAGTAPLTPDDIDAYVIAHVGYATDPLDTAYLDAASLDAAARLDDASDTSDADTL